MLQTGDPLGEAGGEQQGRGVCLPACLPACSVAYRRRCCPRSHRPCLRRRAACPPASRAPWRAPAAQPRARANAPAPTLPPCCAGNGTGGESIWGGEFPDEISRWVVERSSGACETPALLLGQPCACRMKNCCWTSSRPFAPSPALHPSPRLSLPPPSLRSKPAPRPPSHSPALPPPSRALPAPPLVPAPAATCATTAPSRCPWPTPAPTPTAPSSSSPPCPRPVSGLPRRSFVHMLRVLCACGLARLPAPHHRRARALRALLLLAAGQPGGWQGSRCRWHRLALRHALAPAARCRRARPLALPTHPPLAHPPAQGWTASTACSGAWSRGWTSCWR